MKTIKKEQAEKRSKKAPAAEHIQKRHFTPEEGKEMRPRPLGGRFGKKWFPYHK